MISARTGGNGALRWARAEATERQAPLVVVRVLRDDPGAVLAKLSREAALVVVGGPCGGTDVWSTSVGTRLAEETRAPVVVVRGDHGREQERDWPVVVALADVDEADTLLAFAFGTAARQGRPLVVVHAMTGGTGVRTLLPLPATVAYLVPGRGRADHERAVWHARVSAAVRAWSERHPDVPVRVEIAMDDPARAVLARSRHASLLVLGIRRLRERAAVWRLVPSVVPMSRPLELAAIWSSCCPVALVPPATQGGQMISTDEAHRVEVSVAAPKEPVKSS
jgi:hypothetical protein